MTLEEVAETLRAIPALVVAVEKLTIEVRLLREQNPRSLAKSEKVEKLPPGCISLREAQERQFLTIREAAHLLRMSEASVRRAIHRRLIHRSKGLRHIRIPFEELENYRRRTVEGR